MRVVVWIALVLQFLLGWLDALWAAVVPQLPRSGSLMLSAAWFGCTALVVFALWRRPHPGSWGRPYRWLLTNPLVLATGALLVSLVALPSTRSSALGLGLSFSAVALISVLSVHSQVVQRPSADGIWIRRDN